MAPNGNIGVRFSAGGKKHVEGEALAKECRERNETEKADEEGETAAKDQRRKLVPQSQSTRKEPLLTHYALFPQGHGLPRTVS